MIEVEVTMDMKPEVGEPDAGPWQAESLEGWCGGYCRQQDIVRTALGL